jgi:mRNA-degrading endonuclease RelE of RelBE toxin-antitoxin system
VAYRLFETAPFRADLRRLDPSVRARLQLKLRNQVYPALSRSPRFGPNIKRLSGYEPPTWRHRIGDWRLFYSIDDAEGIVFMLAAQPRDRAYR